MPELPEVETVVRELNRALPGRRIGEVEVLRANALGGCEAGVFRDRLVGSEFGRVGRRGKFLIFRLAPRGFLVGHLRMTGKFILAPKPVARLPHDRVRFRLDGGATLIFQDSRCFGTLAVVERLADYGPLGRLGLDALSRRFTADWLARALGSSRAPVKHWLMDQARIAGLGNIYVAEILFRAGISPLRAACDVDRAAAARLHRATRKVLGLAIRKNGTTISDFRRVDEKTGEFQNFLRVYGKAGQPCPACGTAIGRIRQQQRSTFFCPACQT